VQALGERLRVAQLFDDRDCYALFALLRRDAPVWQLPGEPAFLVSSWDLVAQATNRVEDFSNHFRFMLYRHEDGTLGVLETGPNGPDVFAGADPPDHEAHRKLFFSELVQKKIDALEPYVTALVDDLLDSVSDPRGFDVARDLADQLPLRVVAERVIGFSDPDLAEIRRWVFDGSQLMGGMLTLEQVAGSSAAVSSMAPWTMRQLDEALAAETAGDVLAAAAAGVRDGRLTREEAAFTLMVLVGAGAETTTSLIGSAVRLLAERPDLQRQLRDRPALVAPFIEEVLRLESPFRYHPRTAARRSELGGVEIPEGALVLLLWSSANRDDAVFEDPRALRLDRPNARQHFGFGRGIHYCVGAPLARLEARVVLTRLLERTQSLALDPSCPPTWAPSIWLRRHDRLPVVLEGLG
jgi:cytochrome P450 family 144